MFGYPGLNDTKEFDLAFSVRLWKRIQQFQCDRRIGSNGLNETGEAASMVSMGPRNPL
jgi:hypothetical protein